jgi:3-dehydroquinate synthetase
MLADEGGGVVRDFIGYEAAACHGSRGLAAPESAIDD